MAVTCVCVLPVCHPCDDIVIWNLYSWCCPPPSCLREPEETTVTKSRAKACLLSSLLLIFHLMPLISTSLHTLKRRAKSCKNIFFFSQLRKEVARSTDPAKWDERPIFGWNKSSIEGNFLKFYSTKVEVEIKTYKVVWLNSGQKKLDAQFLLMYNKSPLFPIIILKSFNNLEMT